MRPRGFWRHTICVALESFGGQAYSTDVYDWILNNIELTDREISPSPHQNRPYYVNTVRGIINDMSGQGALIHIRDGYYRLPDTLVEQT